MATKASLLRELVHITNISRRRKSESEQAYFNRIVLEVGGLSDDIRVNLSPEAQAWYAGAVEAINQGEMIPTPAPRGAINEADERSENNQEAEDVIPRHEEKNAAPAPVGDIQQEAGNRTKPPSASDRTRRIILDNLGKVEKKTLRELVANAGIAMTTSSFDTIYYETNKTMQIARDMGPS